MTARAAPCDLPLKSRRVRAELMSYITADTKRQRPFREAAVFLYGKHEGGLYQSFAFPTIQRYSRGFEKNMLTLDICRGTI